MSRRTTLTVRGDTRDRFVIPTLFCGNSRAPTMEMYCSTMGIPPPSRPHFLSKYTLDDDNRIDCACCSGQPLICNVPDLCCCDSHLESNDELGCALKQGNQWGLSAGSMANQGPDQITHNGTFFSLMLDETLKNPYINYHCQYKTSSNIF
jgi:hypothetical protein